MLCWQQNLAGLCARKHHHLYGNYTVLTVKYWIHILNDSASKCCITVLNPSVILGFFPSFHLSSCIYFDFCLYIKKTGDMFWCHQHIYWCVCYIPLSYSGGRMWSTSSMSISFINLPRRQGAEKEDIWWHKILYEWMWNGVPAKKAQSLCNDVRK